MRELLYGARPAPDLRSEVATYDPAITDEITLENVAMHYVLWEIPTQSGIDNLPPSLHPTWPGLVSLLFWQVPESPIGSFTFGAIALACRTSIKPRQFVLSAWADTEAARDLLSPRYGYPIQVADVRQADYTDSVVTSVDVDGKRVLGVTTAAMRTISGTSAALKLSPQLSAADVLGERELLQTELGFAFKHTRRGTPRMDTFDAAALGFVSDVPLSIPVAGSLAKVDITLHPARFSVDMEQPAEKTKSRRLAAAAVA